MTNKLRDELALKIIIARDGERDGKRRFQDPIIRDAYCKDAQAVIDHLAPNIMKINEMKIDRIQDDFDNGYNCGLNAAIRALRAWQEKGK